ncbi:mitochondrial potassium channel [Acipenser ruthenus]|uniref:mitochondrial potassium channel n=1 Tax=Acipenser ruthenus TaxID=7906 RepID=UPI00145ABBD6|nr:mitochondrial potassium channel [Acipenser ruthenus]XP_058844799.1 mitochondrial potassium channel [Acipenser ruthenus]XP_058844800.1 mitochondrial potassium channel [Acipenser ruthenus]
MRYRGDLLVVKYGSRFCRSQISGRYRSDVLATRLYCSQSPKDPPSKPPLLQTSMNTLQKVTEVGKQFGQDSAKQIATSTNLLWSRYEEFVGLNEVREAQNKVTEAEKEFMVARGIVRESHESLETLQVKLKEVRDRLDRVSREEAHYLELATLEHKLLQEERRLRTSYENAEESERVKFSLFSVAVRESHEKERTRAERTKNWSVIGSVLGALIGVMGSTYINRVRLQELKNLLLEAQKGPISLQEAIKQQAAMHNSQQEELSSLITNMRRAVGEGVKVEAPAKPWIPTVSKPTEAAQPSEAALKEQLIYSKKTQSLVEALQPKLLKVEQTMGRMVSELQSVRVAVQSRPTERPIIRAEEVQVLDAEDVLSGLAETEQRIEAQMQKNMVYSTVLTYTAFALTLPVLYFIFKGN